MQIKFAISSKNFPFPFKNTKKGILFTKNSYKERNPRISYGFFSSFAL